MCASCTRPSNPLCTLHQVMSMILALSQFEVLQHCCHAALQSLIGGAHNSPPTCCSSLCTGLCNTWVGQALTSCWSMCVCCSC